ncbi:MAG: hypothetical protein HQL94_08380 [Magnetococcales bacterium]|nr:hypothetical protein [Magnetococcales bacterium]MBF0438312.1 hypothetical protein [Magnetococcales bacterium]
MKPSEQLAVVGYLSPASQTTVQNTGYISAADFNSFLCVLNIGAMTSGGTLDAKITQATDANGTGVKDVTGCGMTQILAASGSNKQVVFNLRQDQLDIAGGFGFFTLSITPATQASIIGAVVFGVDPAYESCSDKNVASVVQVVG